VYGAWEVYIGEGIHRIRNIFAIYCDLVLTLEIIDFFLGFACDILVFLVKVFLEGF